MARLLSLAAAWLAAALTLSVLLPAPALAVGTDGVELTPELPRGADGRFLLEMLPEPVERHLMLRNLTDEPRRVRVFAAAATVTEQGAIALGPAGSATWTGLEAQDVELGPQAERRVGFTVDLGQARSAPEHVAFVIEMRDNPTLVMQAASVASVGPPLSAPRWPWILVAAALLALVGSGLVRELRSRRLHGRPTATC